MVNYDETHRQELAFKLAGVSVVLSVINGPAQIALIDAAAQAGVRRFAPAEFEGPAALRPQQDALDRGKRAALERLQYYQTRGMQYTSFVCGILYERFAPGGMYASRIGLRSGIGAEGDYLMNITQKKAQIPFGTNGQAAIVSLTSAEDVGKFVAGAISLPQWPPELRMRGDRMNVSSLVQVAEMVRGIACSPCLEVVRKLTSGRCWLPESSVQLPEHAVSPPACPVRPEYATAASSDHSDGYCQRALRFRIPESQLLGCRDSHKVPGLAAGSLEGSLSHGIYDTLDGSLTASKMGIVIVTWTLHSFIVRKKEASRHSGRSLQVSDQGVRGVRYLSLQSLTF